MPSRQRFLLPLRVYSRWIYDLLVNFSSSFRSILHHLPIFLSSFSLLTSTNKRLRILLYDCHSPSLRARLMIVHFKSFLCACEASRIVKCIRRSSSKSMLIMLFRLQPEEHEKKKQNERWFNRRNTSIEETFLRFLFSSDVLFLGLYSRCSMLRWIACPYQRPLRVRRSIVFPVLLFMITTGLLYALVERTTLTPTDLESSSSPSSVSEVREWCFFPFENRNRSAETKTTWMTFSVFL